MLHDHRCRLVTKDFRILEAMLHDHSGQDEALLVLLRKKLASATMLPPHEIPPCVVTLYSRVRYSVDRQPTTRIVVLDPVQEIVGATLPITHSCGLALLGLAEGAVLRVPGATGLEQTIAVEKVLYQPEAASRAAAPGQPAPLH